ncbi:MAG TPA: ABC transporter ATP-binding protein [Stellaceae bacterium]|jgi:branched-chain amino acid transport system ATP-binding protein
MSAAPMLAVEEIHTYYGESYVLQGISLSVERGRVAAVLGRNGVGKTTLIRSIIAFTPPRRGRVVFAGQDVTRWPSYRIGQAGMGLVPQGRRIFPSLSVRENLEIAARAAMDGTPAIWTVDSALALFPALRVRLKNGAGTLSGGEQQMLAVARALVGNARLILMDEPTEGLSPQIVGELKQLVQKLRDSGLAILLVEQNIEFALDIADTVSVMDKGKIVWHGLPRDLAADEGVQKNYLGL